MGVYDVAPNIADLVVAEAQNHSVVRRVGKRRIDVVVTIRRGPEFGVHVDNIPLAVLLDLVIERILVLEEQRIAHDEHLARAVLRGCFDVRRGRRSAGRD
jgi:hypothetical protein